MKFVLGVLVMGAVLAPSVAFAFTEAENSDENPGTTIVSESGIVPAELVPVAEDDGHEDQWTARFLAPIVVLLGGLAVIIALVMYGIRVRARYQVVG